MDATVIQDMGLQATLLDLIADFDTIEYNTPQEVKAWFDNDDEW